MFKIYILKFYRAKEKESALDIYIWYENSTPKINLLLFERNNINLLFHLNRWSSVRFARRKFLHYDSHKKMWTVEIEITDSYHTTMAPCEETGVTGLNGPSGSSLTRFTQPVAEIRSDCLCWAFSISTPLFGSSSSNLRSDRLFSAPPRDCNQRVRTNQTLTIYP